MKLFRGSESKVFWGYSSTNFIFLLLIDAGRRSLPEDPSAPNLLVKRTLRPIALVKTAPKGEK